MKRTRPIRGKYFLTLPRVVVEGRIIEVKVKLSQVIVADLGPARKSPNIREEDVDDRARLKAYGKVAQRVGEIKRGRVDGEEGLPEGWIHCGICGKAVDPEVHVSCP